MTEDWQKGGFGLYVHWPFCETKCPYCDFNSHVAREIDHARWQHAYLGELRRIATLVPERTLGSVFFGGGTPSLMDPGIVDAILTEARRLWPTANDPEITLEANPGSVEAGRFSEFAAAGINRVSMGVQALNDTDLRRLGRLHSVAEARQAFVIARQYFDRVSFDMIYSRQDQTRAAWREELTEALGMAVDHLSAYQLTIEPGTAFGARRAAGGLRGLPSDDKAADMYMDTQEICEKAGLPAYEISNHARPGSESRHNMVYWRYGDYAGIGPGAHGRLTISGVRHATEQWSNPEHWLTAAETGSADKEATPIPPVDQANEYLMMGLRIRDGIDPTRYEMLAGHALDTETLSYLSDLDMIVADDRNLRVTERGRPLLNAIVTELLTASPDTEAV